MKQASKRILSLCLALVMMLGMSVTVSAASHTLNMAVGDIETISATSTDLGSYQWAVSNPSVVELGDSSGSYRNVIKALSAGSATISVYNANVPNEPLDTWNVTVGAVETELDAFISVTSHELSVGDSYELNVYAYGGTGSYAYQ